MYHCVVDGLIEIRRVVRADDQHDAAEAAAYIAAYFDALILAQWGEKADALRSLEAAFASRDPELVDLKTEPLLDPLRKEPRFQAIERKLKFPQ